MGQCNHEEADTRILVHLLHALQTKSIGLIHTGDIDIVVILLPNHQQIISANPAADIWIYFYAGKSTRIINLNSIAVNLDLQISGTVSYTNGLRQHICFQIYRKTFLLDYTYKMQPISIHSGIKIMQKNTDGPYCVSPSLRGAVANYVCKLYRGEVNQHNVDHLRMDIFSHKMRDVDRLPSTNDALH